MLAAVHLALAGWGMCRLAQRLGLSPLAQVVSGLAYGLSGYLVARAHFLSINAAVAWIPWLLLAVYDLVRSPRPAARNRAGRLALVLAMLLFSGHAQTAWYALMMTGAWLIFWLFQKNGVAHSHDPAEADAGAEGWGSRTTVIGWLAAGALTGLLIAAIQLSPTAELLMESQRAGGADETFVMTYSFWPWRFMGFLVPGFFGSPVAGDYWGYANFWEDAVYIGLLPFLLALRAVFRSEGMGFRPLTRFLAALVVFSFLLALGSNTPVFPFLYRHVPTFDLFQAPSRISILAILSLALLAGIGAQSWAAALSSFSRKQARRLTAVSLAVALAGLSALLWMPFLPPSFGRAVFTAGLVALGAAALGLAKKRDARWRLLAVSLIAADLLAAGWGLNPGVDATFFSESAPNAAVLADEIGAGRLYLFAEDAYEMTFEAFFRFDTFETDEFALRSSMLPNLTALEGLRSANQFDPLVPLRYQRWIDTLEAAPLELQSWMLSQSGVTMLERYRAGEVNPIRFEPRSARPRVEWFPCAIPAESAEQALAVLMKLAEAREKGLVVEGRSGGQCDSALTGEAEITSETANRIVIRVNSPVEGWLLLRDSYYPGWKAAIGDVELDILPGNALFRAVSVPPGENEVRMVYSPASFRLGALLSLAGLFALAGLLVRKREAVA